MKGAVPKSAVQKILVALAEKGELVQKVYGADSAFFVFRGNSRFSTPLPGKTTFFVYNQAKIECLSNENILKSKNELAALEDQNQILSAELKSLTAGIIISSGHPMSKFAHIFLHRTGQDQRKPDRQRARCSYPECGSGGWLRFHSMEKND